jgi:hypothetical protein
MEKNLAFAVNYDLRAKFLRKFLPSLVEGSRAAWCGGASGDEGRKYIRGESTIGYTDSCSAVQTPPCDLYGNILKTDFYPDYIQKLNSYITDNSAHLRYKYK